MIKLIIGEFSHTIMILIAIINLAHNPIVTQFTTAPRTMYIFRSKVEVRAKFELDVSMIIRE